MVSITNTPDSPHAHTFLHLWVCILGMTTWAAVWMCMWSVRHSKHPPSRGCTTLPSQRWFYKRARPHHSALSWISSSPGRVQDMFCSKHTISVLLPTLSDGWQEGRRKVALLTPCQFISPNCWDSCMKLVRGKGLRLAPKWQRGRDPIPRCLSSSTFLPTPYWPTDTSQTKSLRIWL